MNTLGSRLREVREMAEICPEDVAHHVRCDVARLAAFENDEAVPSDVELERLSALYHVRAAALRDGVPAFTEAELLASMSKHAQKQYARGSAHDRATMLRFATWLRYVRT